MLFYSLPKCFSSPYVMLFTNRFMNAFAPQAKLYNGNSNALLFQGLLPKSLFGTVNNILVMMISTWCFGKQPKMIQNERYSLVIVPLTGKSVSEALLKSKCM